MEASTGSRRVLVIDPDPLMREQVGESLLRAGYEVTAAAATSHGIEELGRRQYDAVILSVDGDDEEAGEASDPFERLAEAAPLLVLCDPARVRSAVQALRRGAEDYVLRPFDPFELRRRLERILERRDLDSRIAFFQDELTKKFDVRSFEARSPAMRSVLDRVLRVAPRRTTVLITGESGVGKELVARAIHFNSARRDQPLVALNCAAIPASLIETELFGHEKGSFTGALARVRGKFEIAHRGTLFLDEIGEMEPTTQAKLLRVLDEREFMRVGGDRSIRVDVRLIAATNADLEARVERGEFRQDLYYRLKVVSIPVPPLRERRADLPFLVHTFLDQLARANAVYRKSVTPEAMVALEQHAWPGNVRELKNLLESVLVSIPGETITVADLPGSIRREAASPDVVGFTPGTTLAEMERVLIGHTLEASGGNRTHSAALLGIGVRTLQRKMRLYGLSMPSSRRRPRKRRAP